MAFKLIHGGASDVLEKKELSIQQKFERVKMMKCHMRSIESSMASLNHQAKQIGWDKISGLVDETHKHIIEILRIIKKTEKASGVLNKQPNLKVIDSVVEPIDENNIS